MGIAETEIFDFWESIGPAERVHPRDEPVFDRLRGQHGFNLKCLPASFNGPLRKAKVVLLYLSPGFSPQDLEDARTQEGQRRYMQRRTGNALLTGQNDHESGWRWWTSRTKWLGTPERLRTELAILNIGAYHSEAFVDEPLLAALPSSRVSLDWAQGVLFPQACRGERVRPASGDSSSTNDTGPGSSPRL